MFSDIFAGRPALPWDRYRNFDPTNKAFQKRKARNRKRAKVQKASRRRNRRK